MDKVKQAIVLGFIVALTGCGRDVPEPPAATAVGDVGVATPALAPTPSDDGCAADAVQPLYADQVIALTPGTGAGFGSEKFPGVVLGPSHGAGMDAGSLDVLSLGNGGEIILGFKDRVIRDQAGPDFIVFENAFWPQGDQLHPWAELAEVSASADGTTWVAFPCDAAGDGAGHWASCAGWRPVLQYNACVVTPLDPTITGGDPFDLADVGLTEARYVKIRDIGTTGSAPNAGFDLDAVGLVNP